jgi:predicted RNA-binding protein with PUA-like domain
MGPSSAPAAPPAAGWLFKSEPSVYSVADLKREQRCRWDGVRNYQARNFLRLARVGDPVAFWHSNTAQSGVAGLGKVLKAAYPDPTAFDKKHAAFDPKSDPANPRWFSVDVGFVAQLPRVIPAAQLRADPALSGLLFFRQGRLSVCPAEASAWKRLAALCAAALKSAA